MAILSSADSARLQREKRGWSREKLAAEAGISFQTVYRLEHGRLPRVEHLVRIADALAVSLDELIGRSIGTS
jgi:transcriptional regulator with XRE-family HTH domain